MKTTRDPGTTASAADERGFAFVVVLLLTVALAAMSMAAVTVVGNASLIASSSDRQAAMEDAAVSGLELGRALLNNQPSLFPQSGYLALPSEAVQPRDALGQPIPGITRTVYAGPSGIATGQYGVYGSVVSVVEDGTGNRVVRRLEMVQESFARYAYFTDKETSVTGTPIYFAPGDQLFGPVHSNDVIRIMQAPGGPIFHGPVTTAKTIQDAWRAQFRQGKQERAAAIAMPGVAQLTRLEELAQQGSAAFTSSGHGSQGEATLRIEFVAIDLDGDGGRTGADEGFFKVYRAKTNTSAGARWVSAGQPSDPTDSENCGHRHLIASKHYFYSAPLHDVASARDAANQLLEGSSVAVLKGQPGHQPPRCYLGGSDSLSTQLDFRADDGRGTWVPYPVPWASSRPAAVDARADADYLFPLSRRFNPNFRGVIHVAGKVAVSGELRGRVTLAATGNIAIADDVSYATDPAAASCEDILGLFSGANIVVSDNLINAPVDVGSPGSDYRSFEASTDEVIHAVILTLGSFTVENYGSGSDRAQGCEGANTGRGCLYVTGGIIQTRRGAVGQQSGSGVTGYLKRYAYDACASSNPPPYFPTTGYFARGRQYEVDPVGFDVARLFDFITAG